MLSTVQIFHYFLIYCCQHNITQGKKKLHQWVSTIFTKLNSVYKCKCRELTVIVICRNSPGFVLTIQVFFLSYDEKCSLSHGLITGASTKKYTKKIKNNHNIITALALSHL